MANSFSEFTTSDRQSVRTFDSYKLVLNGALLCKRTDRHNPSQRHQFSHFHQFHRCESWSDEIRRISEFACVFSRFHGVWLWFRILCRAYANFVLSMLIILCYGVLTYNTLENGRNVRMWWLDDWKKTSREASRAWSVAHKYIYRAEGLVRSSATVAGATVFPVAWPTGNSCTFRVSIHWRFSHSSVTPCLNTCMTSIDVQ